ncbi:hypothetical protein L7F22_062039 [Adiantum nelumboides]|nr:hypothetical protein [Adiantum nelumboides]
MKDFEAIQIQHISRQHNKEADNMANSQFEVMVGAIKFKEPLFQGQETMEDILYILETGECPNHLERVQRHRLVRKALSYQLIVEYLYHKGKDLVLRRVPLVKEIETILMSCHDGVCGGHFAQEITSRKILQAGFVWPSLHRDVQHWCKACKACQQAGDRKLSYGPRFPIFAYGPFEKWGIDAIGPLPRTSTGKQYILTATDYMTRWAEAASVARITAADVSKFVLDYICSRFGTPLEILSDRGPGFRADLLDALLENLSIKHVHSTPYYPQCNGLVEKTNGVLCKIITKHVRDRPQDWDKYLTPALWAYRTSFKVSTQFTPYHLVYGQEALLPIEVELGSLRVLARETTSSKEKLEQRILDLQRLELDREAATDYYITQANKKREQFNNKVKEKKLEEGMLVMSEWSLSVVIEATALKIFPLIVFSPCFSRISSTEDEENKIEDEGDTSQATQQVLPTIDEETSFHKGDAMSTQEVVDNESDFVAQKPSNDMNKGSENMLPTIGETQILEGNTRNSEEKMVVVENQSDVQTSPKHSNDMIIKDTYNMPLRDEKVEGSEKKDEANEEHQGALATTEVQDKVDKGTREATRNANKAQSIQGRVQGTEGEEREIQERLRREEEEEERKILEHLRREEEEEERKILEHLRRRQEEEEAQRKEELAVHYKRPRRCNYLDPYFMDEL